jgi:hypothetical protein
MRLLLRCLLSLLAGFILPPALVAAEYSLADGSVVRGEPLSPDQTGIVFRLEDGAFSQRYAWSKFTQDALKNFAQDPKIKRFVEPFIEVPPEIRQKARREAIRIQQPPRLERPPANLSFGAAFATPGGLAILAVLFLANLYAAYEIARYRNRPIPLVCGAAIIAPVLAPALFLGLPRVKEKAATAAAIAPPAEGAAPPADGAPAAPEAAAPVAPDPVNPLAEAQEAARTMRPGIHDETDAPAAELKLTKRTEQQAAGLDYQQVIKRGDQVINRRLFETKFPGFFRIVPPESQKDLVLVVSSLRGVIVARRISRISNDEIHLQLQQGNASAEVLVPFAEITEIKVRHKDAEK